MTFFLWAFKFPFQFKRYLFYVFLYFTIFKIKFTRFNDFVDGLVGRGEVLDQGVLDPVHLLVVDDLLKEQVEEQFINLRYECK